MARRELGVGRRTGNCRGLVAYDSFLTLMVLVGLFNIALGVFEVALMSQLMIDNLKDLFLWNDGYFVAFYFADVRTHVNKSSLGQIIQAATIRAIIVEIDKDHIFN